MSSILSLDSLTTDLVGGGVDKIDRNIIEDSQPLPCHGKDGRQSWYWITGPQQELRRDTRCRCSSIRWWQVGQRVPTDAIGTLGSCCGGCISVPTEGGSTLFNQ